MSECKKSLTNPSALPTCREDPCIGDHRKSGLTDHLGSCFFHCLLGWDNVTKTYSDFIFTSQGNYRKQVDFFFLFKKKKGRAEFCLDLRWQTLVERRTNCVSTLNKSQLLNILYSPSSKTLLIVLEFTCLLQSSEGNIHFTSH